MKRKIKDNAFSKSMIKIEKEVAKIFGVTHPYVTAAWNGDNKIQIIVAEKAYELEN